MFLSKNKKNRVTPASPSLFVFFFFYIKVGFKWIYFSWTCFPDIWSIHDYSFTYIWPQVREKTNRGFFFKSCQVSIVLCNQYNVFLGRPLAEMFIMSRLMGKPTICMGENKDADHLRGNREADQRLCFRYSSAF